MRTLQSLFRGAASSPGRTMGLVIHLLIVVWIISLFILPQNTLIRPLEWLVNGVSFNLVVFPIALVLALYDWRAGKKPVAVAGFVLWSSLYLAAIGYLLLVAFVKRIALSG